MCYEFGPFALDLERGELRKHGLRILHSESAISSPQDSCGAGRPGGWPRGSTAGGVGERCLFVDFEHGLNAAMNKLRRALGDSVESPRYIETLAGRGYRFIGPLVPTVITAPTIAIEAISNLKGSPLETLPPLSAEAISFLPGRHGSRRRPQLPLLRHLALDGASDDPAERDRADRLFSSPFLSRRGRSLRRRSPANPLQSHPMERDWLSRQPAPTAQTSGYVTLARWTCGPCRVPKGRGWSSGRRIAVPSSIR